MRQLAATRPQRLPLVGATGDKPAMMAAPVLVPAPAPAHVAAQVVVVSAAAAAR